MGLNNLNDEQIDYVIGVDFGTDSVRAVLVNALNGNEVDSEVFNYPRWKQKTFCEAAKSQFRQHPLDYIEGLKSTIGTLTRRAGDSVAERILAISIDTTGSTPVAVDRAGTPLALLPEFENNPNAMFVLWKDHTATKEAAEINRHAAAYEGDYLKYVGGIYSSEWFWAKLLYILRVDPAIQAACYSWVEHCDWIPFLLTGGSDVTEMKRSVCAAGHKALWAEEFGGLPPDDFFNDLDPLLSGFTKRLYQKTYTSDQAAGTLSSTWAEALGLNENVVVGVGAFDCHMGAVGGEIEPFYLSKVMGTSTCDMLIAPPEDVGGRLVAGICGQVHGSILPGMIGMEAGQSAFGDAYAWFRDNTLWPLRHFIPKASFLSEENANALLHDIGQQIIPELTRLASELPLTLNDPIAVDWLNGRRTPDANQELKASFMGFDLGTDSAMQFRTLLEATCFGAKAIVDRFITQGIPVKGLIGLGGVARKAPFIMQMMADVLAMPIKIHRSEQSCALGAAMFAATAAGVYRSAEEAMKAMGQGFDLHYEPDKERSEVYQQRYQRYLQLGAFTETWIAKTKS